MIEIRNISKDYISAMGVVTKCLNDISLVINKGDICALCGESGSGKTTILNIIACLDRPSSGDILVNGKSLLEKNMNIDSFRLNNIGIIFQSFNLIDILTVSENIKMPAELSDKKFDKDFFDNIINDLGINEFLNKFPSELSGGEQQRVAIARALINKPMLLLADEPTGNLDSKNTSKVIKLLIKMVEKYNMTLGIVTHDENVANQCQRIVYIQDGKIYEK